MESFFCIKNLNYVTKTHLSRDFYYTSILYYSQYIKLFLYKVNVQIFSLLQDSTQTNCYKNYTLYFIPFSLFLLIILIKMFKDLQNSRSYHCEKYCSVEYFKKNFFLMWKSQKRISFFRLHVQQLYVCVCVSCFYYSKMLLFWRIFSFICRLFSSLF